MVLTQFRRTAERYAFAYLAYCLMPDHAHALVEGLTPEAELTSFVKSAKESSGRACFRRTGGPLWQEGYYERILREDDDARAIARYIIDNPRRAGLVLSPLDYALVGSDRWTMRELIESL